MNDISRNIIEIIKTSMEPISAKMIVEKLEKHNQKVNIKTIYEYIRKINLYYQPILKKDYIGMKRRVGYFIENDLFEDGQLQYLVDAVLSNQSLSLSEATQLKDRLLSFSSNNQKNRLFMSSTLNHSSYDALLNLTTIIKAIDHQQLIYFQYVDYQVSNQKLVEVSSKNGNLKVNDQIFYVVSPYYLSMVGNHYYLHGFYDQRDNQISTYRIDRMRLIRKYQGKYIDIRDQIDVHSDINQSINQFVSSKKIDLQLKFKRSAMREIVNQFGKNYDFSQFDHSLFEVKIPEVSYSPGLVSWLLMLSNQVEVVKPQSLREEMKMKINEMIKIYK